MSIVQTSQEPRSETLPLRLCPRYPFDALWQADIARCEGGRSPVLGTPCRCGGKLFGRQRGNGFAFFANLPAGDPHSFQVPVASSARVSSLTRRHLAG